MPFPTPAELFQQRNTALAKLQSEEAKNVQLQMENADLVRRNGNQSDTIRHDRETIRKLNERIGELEEILESRDLTVEAARLRLQEQSNKVKELDDRLARLERERRVEQSLVQEAVEASEAFRLRVSDAMRLIQKHICITRNDNLDIESIYIEGQHIKFSDFFIHAPAKVEIVSVVIRGKKHIVSLDELARLIKGGAHIESIDSGVVLEKN